MSDLTRRRWAWTAVSGLVALAGASPASADPCAVTLGVSNVNISWNLNFTFQAVTFTVTKTSATACDYGIAFSRGGASNYSRRLLGPAGVNLPYQLYKDVNLTQILKYAGDIAGANDVILGHFDTGAQAAQTLTYYVQVPLGTATAPSFKPYGSYTDTFNISAYEGLDPVQFSTAIATQSVNLGATLPKIVELSVGNPGVSFDPSQVANSIAFGTVYSGVVAQRDLLVRTNAGYSITFSSANRGVMKHTDVSVSTTIPYTFNLNAAAIDLSPATSAPVLVSGQTSLEGNRNPILLKIGNIQNTMAGSYSDTISITVITTD